MTDFQPQERQRLRVWLAARPGVALQADDLAAWAEGQLNAERMAVVELALAQDPALRRAVRAWLSPAPPPHRVTWLRWWFALRNRMTAWETVLIPVTAALVVGLAVPLGLTLGEGIANGLAAAHEQRVASLLGPLFSGENHVH
jgi:hypothetical protein